MLAVSRTTETMTATAINFGHALMQGDEGLGLCLFHIPSGLGEKSFT
jgi:hypothetical protein